MHLLAIKDTCSGGSCPAVYDSDEDLRGDELAVVGTTVPGITARLADRIAADEAARRHQPIDRRRGAAPGTPADHHAGV